MGKVKIPWKKVFPKLLIIILVFIGVAFSALSIIRHMHFESGAFDLGLFDQAVWRFAHFLSPYNTIKERMIWGDHLTLLLPLYSILYFLWSDVRILLVFQVICIVTSAFPIYYIAKKRLESHFAGIILSLLYVLFYGIQYAVFFDFHPVVIGVALLSWLAFFWELKAYRYVLITLMLTLLTQENMGIGVLCLSFLFFFRREYRKSAIIMGGIGLVYSVAAMKVSALLSPVGYQYWPQLPTNPIQLITRLFDAPEKMQVWFYSYTWYLFLPLLSPGSILAVIADVSQYFVTGTEFARMWSPFMHHRAILSPFLTLGTVDAILVLKSKHIPVGFVCAIFGVSMLTQQFVFHLPLNKLSKSAFTKKEVWMSDMEAVIGTIPKKASLAAQQNLVPHVSQRKEIYLVWPRIHDFQSKPCEELQCWWLDFGGRPDYLLVDIRSDQWITQTLETPEHFLSAVGNMENAKIITVQSSLGSARLYKIHWDILSALK